MPSVLNERLKGLKVYVIFICLSESIGYPDVNTEKIVIVFFLHHLLHIAAQIRKLVLGNSDVKTGIILAGFHCPLPLCCFVLQKNYEELYVHYQYHASTIPFCLFRLLLRTFLF